MGSRHAIVIIAVLLAGCTSMAPGIQFSNASRSGEGSKEINPDIQLITPALVKAEREARSQRVTEDISALMQPSQPYKIAPGDVLHIVVWDHPELSASMMPAMPPGTIGVAASPMQPANGFEVDLNGMLDFPYAGKLKVAGMTSAEVHGLLTSKLAHYIRNPKVTLRVLNYRSTCMSMAK